MKEDFLHFVWQFSYFKPGRLQTSNSEEITILSSGILNTDAGPDFHEARLIIDRMYWSGNIEMHIRSSDWNRHKHSSDAAYDTVVLHVVWEHDQEVYRTDGTLIPVLELKNHVEEELLFQYEKIMSYKGKIPCAGSLSNVREVTLIATLDKVLVQRYSEKYKNVFSLLEQNAGDWDETAYQLLARYMGGRLNNEAMFQLALRIPYRVLLRYKGNRMAQEALLLGRAGLLNRTFKQAYPLQLQQEYSYLKDKHQWKEREMCEVEWKFSKIRPAGFPSLRLMILASVVNSVTHLFDRLNSVQDLNTLKKILSSTMQEYWQRHYYPDAPESVSFIQPGKELAEAVWLNVVLPLQLVWSKYQGEENYHEKLIYLLESVPPENNTITRMFRSLGWPLRNGADSQAILQLHQSFCKNTACLSCPVGTELMKRKFV